MSLRPDNCPIVDCEKLWICGSCVRHMERLSSLVAIILKTTRRDQTEFDPLVASPLPMFWSLFSEKVTRLLPSSPRFKMWGNPQDLQVDPLDAFSSRLLTRSGFLRSEPQPAVTVSRTRLSDPRRPLLAAHKAPTDPNFRKEHLTVTGREHQVSSS